MIFDPMCIILFTLKCILTSLKVFFSVFKTHIVNMIEFNLIKIRLNMFRYSLLRTYFLIIMQQDSSTAMLTIKLFSCCQLNLFLGTGSCPRPLLGLPLTYLKLESPRTLHSSHE